MHRGSGSDLLQLLSLFGLRYPLQNQCFQGTFYGITAQILGLQRKFAIQQGMGGNPSADSPL